MDQSQLIPMKTIAKLNMQDREQAGHTPGPWSVSTERGILDIGAPGAGLLAMVSRSQLLGDSNANARLFAAAPELLAALTNALNVLAGIATGDLATVHRDSPAIAQARAAIAKATKQQGKE